MQPGSELVRLVPRQRTVGLEWLAVLVRHRRLIALSFVAVFIGVLLIALPMPVTYQAEMKFLVKHERPDPVVTPGAQDQVRVGPGAVSEQELNAEVDLLKSRDLLEKVVLENGLAGGNAEGTLGSMFGSSRGDEQQQRTAAAVEKLAGKLEVVVLDKSNLIRVRYDAPDPQMAARVLNSLSTHYIEKHIEVRRTPGTSEFFEEQAARYLQQLKEAEAKLGDFGQSEGTVAAEAEKTSVLQRMAEFEASLQQTQAAIGSTQQRIRTLEQQRARTPERRVTQIRTSAKVLEDLNAALYKLELQRSELLQKYSPTYRAVVDTERQIEAARAAIAEAQKKPTREEITDGDPTHMWLTAELAKARADLAALKAQAGMTSRTVTGYRQTALDLDGKQRMQQELLRAATTAEENYLLYRRKHEEARMTEELDKRRFLNVAVAEAATVPALPSSTRSSRVGLAFVLALMTSVGMAFLVDYFDPSFRTPAEVEGYLQVPVLAVLPRTQLALPLRGSSDVADGPQARGGASF